MSGLFQSLSVATSGLSAAQLGLDLAGQNIANINTPGYSRRTLSQAELAPTEPLSAGRGVEVTEIRAVRDRYVEARLGREQAGAAYDAAVFDGLSEVEGAIGLPGSSIDARLTAFFDSFSALSVDVTSPSARDAVVRESQQLATSFNEFDTRLADAARNADHDVRVTVTEIGELTATIATLNTQISRDPAGAESLKDQRNEAILKLSALVDVSVIERSDGLVDVATAGGNALVVGGNAYSIDVVATPPSGYASLRLHDIDVTSLVGGRAGGLVALRDIVVPRYRAALDQLAYDVATAVNTLHASGVDGTGNPSADLFVAPAAVAGAAAGLRVSAAVLADSRLVAGSATASAGDNQIARAIAAIRDARVATSGTATPAEGWSQLAYLVGADLASTRASTATRDQVVLQLQRLRDSVSGVSLDEEAAHLMRYQRSYEANARYFTTVVDTLNTLMQMVR